MHLVLFSHLFSDKLEKSVRWDDCRSVDADLATESSCSTVTCSVGNWRLPALLSGSGPLSTRNCASSSSGAESIN